MGPAVPTNRRLGSLDALRGFDMVWILGGREVVLAAAAWTGWGWLEAAGGQLHHAEWHGFTAWDLIFPLFLFLAGVSFPLSLDRRRGRGDSERSIRAHVVRRGLLLVALGVLYNLGPSFDLSDPRYASVLGRIGLAWMFAALIALRFRPRGQWVWIALLLGGYHVALVHVGAPTGPGAAGGASLAPGETLTDWVDRALLPGRLHRGVRDPEGLLSTVPAIATALLGMAAGRRLAGGPSWTKAARLALVGAVGLALGWLWDASFPINKNLWSSSFVLWTAGWSALLLAAFHALVDLRGWRWPVLVFAPIGANALAAYLLTRLLELKTRLGGTVAALLEHRVDPAAGEAGGAWPELVGAVVTLGAVWALCRLAYRRRWFLRI